MKWMFVCLPPQVQTVETCWSRCGWIMRLSWQLCWCQGGSARLAAHCVIQWSGVVGICSICAAADCFQNHSLDLDTYAKELSVST